MLSSKLDNKNYLIFLSVRSSRSINKVVRQLRFIAAVMSGGQFSSV